MITTLPYRANRMDDAPCRQFESRADFRLAGAAAIQGAAELQQQRTCGAVYGAIHTTTAHQTAVRSIDDFVNIQSKAEIMLDFEEITCHA